MVRGVKELGCTVFVEATIRRNVGTAMPSHGTSISILGLPLKEKLKLQGVRNVKFAPLFGGFFFPESHIEQVLILWDLHHPQCRSFDLSRRHFGQRLITEIPAQPSSDEGQGPVGPSGMSMAPAEGLEATDIVGAISTPPNTQIFGSTIQEVNRHDGKGIFFLRSCSLKSSQLLNVESTSYLRSTQ